MSLDTVIKVTMGVMCTTFAVTTGILAYKDVLEIQVLRKKRDEMKFYKRDVRIHNYIQEEESGISWDDYKKRTFDAMIYVSVEMRRHSRMGDVWYCEQLHSQMAALRDDDIATLLARAIVRVESREAFYHLFPISDLVYCHKLGIHYNVTVGTAVLDKLTVGVTAEQLKELAAEARRIQNEQKNNPLILRMKMHKQEILKRLKHVEETPPATAAAE